MFPFQAGSQAITKALAALGRAGSPVIIRAVIY